MENFIFYSNNVRRFEIDYNNKDSSLIAVFAGQNYIIYYCLTLLQKAEGNAEKFIWSNATQSEYATQNGFQVKIFKNNNEPLLFTLKSGENMSYADEQFSAPSKVNY